MFSSDPLDNGLSSVGGVQVKNGIAHCAISLIIYGVYYGHGN